MNQLSLILKIESIKIKLINSIKIKIKLNPSKMIN